MSESEKKSLAACQTLEKAGYTYHGGELWEPPLGPSPMPLLDQIEVLQAKVASLEHMNTALNLAVENAQWEAQEPVAWRAWFDEDHGARWLFTLWPDEERLDVEWEPLFTAPPLTLSQALKDHNIPAQHAEAFSAGWVAAMQSATKHKVEPGGVAVAVDHAYEYQFMDTCPKGAQVWLCTEYGVGIPGSWNGKDPQFIGWSPKPKIPKRMKELMKWAKT